MKTLLKYTAILLTVFTSSCNSEDALDIFKTRGAPKTEARQLNAFHELKVGNGINVVLISGSTNSAMLDGWENLLPKVKLAVNNSGLLTIEDTNNFNIVRDLSNTTTVYLTYDGEINAIYMNGDGLISTNGELKSTNLTILSEDASGSIKLTINANSMGIGTNHRNTADIAIDGSCYYMGITNWGNAPMDFSKLVVQMADITHRGACDLYVNVVQQFTAALYGIGDIYYTGNPTLAVERRGKGNVYRK